MQTKYIVHVAFAIGITVTNICSVDTRIEKKEIEEEIPLTEDLMREHGLLNRILLIYEEIARRLDNNETPLKALGQAASIIQDFIENYHEKLEENYLFPLFEKNKKHVPLIKTLRQQHTAGRAITAKLKDIAQSEDILDKKTKKYAITLIKKFVRMYRPHEAQEDTILFPEVRSLISKKEFEKLSEKFEDMEHELFGKKGFFMMLKKVEKIEKALGIYKLAQFTSSL